MELAWTMLANHAEIAPNGLLYIAGAGWDTVNVTEPLPPGAPDGAVTVVQGVLVLRLLFHATEVDTDYPFRVGIVDEDGGEIGRVDGEIRANRQDIPAAWPHPSTIVVSLTGLPLPRFGEYRISVQVNREHKGDAPFRVVQRY